MPAPNQISDAAQKRQRSPHSRTRPMQSAARGEASPCALSAPRCVPGVGKPHPTSGLSSSGSGERCFGERKRSAWGSACPRRSNGRSWRDVVELLKSRGAGTQKHRREGSVGDGKSATWMGVVGDGPPSQSEMLGFASAGQTSPHAGLPRRSPRKRSGGRSLASPTGFEPVF